MKAVHADRILNWAVFGNVYLWFLAALLQLTIVVYGHDTLQVNEAHISYLQAAVGIGIGVGSVVAGYLSRGKIDIRLIPIGALGMTIFGALLYPSGHTVHSAAAHLAALGFFGGFFAVPLNALIQHRPDPAHRGRRDCGGEFAVVHRRVFRGGGLLSFFDGFSADAGGSISGWRGFDRDHDRALFLLLLSGAFAAGDESRRVISR